MNASCSFPCRMQNGRYSQALVCGNTRLTPRSVRLTLLFAEAPFDPLAAPFLTNQSISSYSALEDLNSLPNFFQRSNEIDFTHFSASRKSKRSHDTVFEHVALSPSLNQGFSSNFASSIDFLGAGTSVEQHQATFPADNHSAVPSPTDGSMVALTARVNTQAEQTALPSQASTISTRPEQPPRNSDGEMICDHIDCSHKNLIFTNIRDWS
jgi:hypothetical protein